MKDNNINKNNKLAGWIEDFLTNFAKTTNDREVKATKETIAEININDLDKVVWNDETFYVYFDETGASIINVFGNIVTVLDGITTLEDVNKQLNSKQIVSGIEEELVVNAEIENEIEQALSNIKADVNDDQVAQEYVDSYNEQTNNESERPEQQDNSFSGLTSTGLVEMIAPLKTFDEKTAAMISEKFAEMEEKLINTFEEKINAMMEQMYARINPGNIYDMSDQVQREEVLKFTDEAAETEQQISQENAIDRTIVDNRYSTQPSEIEQPLIQDNIEDIDNEEVIEENDVEEVINESIDNDEVSDKTITNDDNVEVLEESEAEEVTDDDDIIELEEINEEDDEEIEDVELEGDDAEVFKQAKCPYCSTSLSKTAMKDNSIEITCDNHDCGTRYSVDINTGKIYII